MKLCGHDIGLDQPLFPIAGPDTLEFQELAIELTGHIKAVADKLGAAASTTLRRAPPPSRAIARNR